MFRIINKYQTGDGATHDTEKKAREHIESNICQTLENIIIKSEPHKAARLKYKDVFEIVKTLHEHRAAIRQALELEQFGDDGRDDETEND